MMMMSIDRVIDSVNTTCGLFFNIVRSNIMAEETTSTRGSVCKKVYVNADGTESRSATPDATELHFRFNDGDSTVRVVKLGDFPADIETRLAWFGRSEKLGNFYAGAKGDANVALEDFDTGVELLLTGDWSERKEGMGPRPSLVADAIISALEKVGQPVNDDGATKIREMVKDKTTRDGALKDPVIKAEYEAMRAARAAEKAKAAAKAAKGATLSFTMA
jgi:hypothetical protein